MTLRVVLAWVGMASASLLLVASVQLTVGQPRAALLFLAIVWILAILWTRRLPSAAAIQIGAGMVLMIPIAINPRLFVLAAVLWFAISQVVLWSVQFALRAMHNVPLATERVEPAAMAEVMSPAAGAEITTLQVFLSAHGFEPRPVIYHLGSGSIFCMVGERGSIRAVIGLYDRGRFVTLELLTTFDAGKGLLQTLKNSTLFPAPDYVIRQRFPEATLEELLVHHVNAMDSLTEAGLQPDLWPIELNDADLAKFSDETGREFLRKPIRHGLEHRRVSRTRKTPDDGSIRDRVDLERRIDAIRDRTLHP